MIQINEAKNLAERQEKELTDFRIKLNEENELARIKILDEIIETLIQKSSKHLNENSINIVHVINDITHRDDYNKYLVREKWAGIPLLVGADKYLSADKLTDIQVAASSKTIHLFYSDGYSSLIFENSELKDLITFAEFINDCFIENDIEENKFLFDLHSEIDKKYNQISSINFEYEKLFDQKYKCKYEGYLLDLIEPYLFGSVGNKVFTLDKTILEKEEFREEFNPIFSKDTGVTFFIPTDSTHYHYFSLFELNCIKITNNFYKKNTIDDIYIQFNSSINKKNNYNLTTLESIDDYYNFYKFIKTYIKHEYPCQKN